MDHNTHPGDGSAQPLHEPVPSLVNTALVEIAQAVVPELRSRSPQEIAERAWFSSPQLVLLPEGELEAIGAVTNPAACADGREVALGTALLMLQDPSDTEDTHCIYLNIMPYSEQGLPLALEVDALTHAIALAGAAMNAPRRTHSIWFLGGAPSAMSGLEETYTVHAAESESAPVHGEPDSVSVVVYSDQWPPLDEDGPMSALWNLLDQAADRLAVSLRD